MSHLLGAPAANIPEPAPARTDKRRFVEGSAIGGVIAFAVFAGVLTLTGGHPDLLRHDVFGNFFDAQARALLHGRWDVPAREASFEGFALGSKTYLCFGIWPSLMRMPILAVAPSLQGRLTQLSMLGGFAVFLVALSALHWQIRALVRPGRACGRIEPAVVVLAGSCGSAILFTANRAIVYDEVLVWGIALSVLAYDRILALVRTPSTLRLAVACLCAALAFLTRASVGLGPVAALGIIAAGQLVAAVAGERNPNVVARLDWVGVRTVAPASRVRWVTSCVGAALVPLFAYAVVNYARFHSAFGIPWTKYRIVAFNTQYQVTLAHNGNNVFGAKFAPTTLLQYLRPDALAPSALFPWVTFPHFRASIVGGVHVIERTMATSLTASMPVLVLLGAVGVVALLRPAVARERAVAFVRAPLLGSVVAVVPTVAIVYVADRYLGDFVPLLLLPALVGLHTLLRRREERGASQDRERRVGRRRRGGALRDVGERRARARVPAPGRPGDARATPRDGGVPVRRRPDLRRAAAERHVRVRAPGAPGNRVRERRGGELRRPVLVGRPPVVGARRQAADRSLRPARRIPGPPDTTVAADPRGQRG